MFFFKTVPSLLSPSGWWSLFSFSVQRSNKWSQDYLETVRVHSHHTSTVTKPNRAVQWGESTHETGALCVSSVVRCVCVRLLEDVIPCHSVMRTAGAKKASWPKVLFCRKSLGFYGCQL